MNIQRKPILLVFLILLIPSTLFGGHEIKTGYDIYHYIKRMDNPQSNEEDIVGMYTAGYLVGFIDAIAFTQDAIFSLMFNPNILSEKEIEQLSKEVNFSRVNLPEKGLHAEQFTLIFKKYAEKHPDKLNETARFCIWESLIEAYGWK